MGVWVFLRCCLNLSLIPCPSPVIWVWRTGVRAHPWSAQLRCSLRVTQGTSQASVGSGLSSPRTTEGKGRAGPGDLATRHGRLVSGRLRQEQVPTRSGGVDRIPCGWEAAAQALPGVGQVCVAVPVFMAACVCTRGHTCVFPGRCSVGARGAATLHCSTPVPVNYKLVYYHVSRHPIPFCFILGCTQ